jgi:hypothetical protein
MDFQAEIGEYAGSFSHRKPMKPATGRSYAPMLTRIGDSKFTIYDGGSRRNPAITLALSTDKSVHE